MVGDVEVPGGAFIRVLTALEFADLRVDRKSGGAMAQCPAHSDENPSLSVTDSEDRVLVKCHAECATEDIVEALGLTMADLFDDAAGSSAFAPERQAIEYIYRDENGQPLSRVVRHEPKDFRQQRWNGSTWDPTLGEAQRVLFRLPELVAGVAAREWVFVVEGEKDAERLAAEGFTATTIAMGANTANWDRTDTSVLRGAYVAVIGDNDRSGRKYAHHVAKSLTGQAAQVRLIRLDGLPDKGDVSDWLDQGHTTDELRKMVDEAPEWEPSASPEPDAVTLRAVQRASESRIEWAGFFHKERAGEDWLVEPIIPRGRQVVIYSKAKQGKSLLMLELAAAAATGRAILGRPEGPVERVLYVDKEMTEDDVWERLQDLGYTAEDEPLLKENLAYYQLPVLPPMDTEPGGKVLLRLALDHQATLVVIDTMSRVVQGKENENDTWQDFYLHTGMLLKHQAITLARLDHSGKDGSKGQRGGSSKYDDPDVVFELTYNQPRVALKTKGVSRVNWVPSLVNLIRETNPLRHTWKQDAYNDRERDLADLLDRLDLPADISKRKAKENADEKIAAGFLDSDDIAIATASSAIWSGAVRIRKNRADAGTTPRTNSVEAPKTTSRTTAEESLHSKAGTTPGTTENHSQQGMGTGSRLLGGNRFPPAPECTVPQPTPGDRQPNRADTSDRESPTEEPFWPKYPADLQRLYPNDPSFGGTYETTT